MANKKKMTLIDDTKVNFVCNRCNKIYYQADHEDFNSNPEAVVLAAKKYKSHYHKCKGGNKR